MKSVVLAKIPRAGLANKLLVWAHALTFSVKYKLNLYETSWIHVPVGPILRREKSKRLYFNIVQAGDTIPITHRLLCKQVVLPKSDWTNIIPESSKIYVFKEVPYHKTYFDLIAPLRSEIIQSFFRRINQKLLLKANNISSPAIALHIRRGDFKKMPWVHYDWDWYRKLIFDIRGFLKEDVPVTVFSDGRADEIDILKDVKNIHYFSSGNDLIDLIVMARAKVIVPYPGSTYSLWAGFISDSIIIHKNNYNIRHLNSQDIYEGNPYMNNTFDQKLEHQLKKKLVYSPNK